MKKKTKFRMKKTVRRTVAALLMITALIIAAIPSQYISAQTSPLDGDEISDDDNLIFGTDDKISNKKMNEDLNKYTGVAYKCDDGLVYYVYGGLLTGIDVREYEKTPIYNDAHDEITGWNEYNPKFPDLDSVDEIALPYIEESPIKYINPASFDAVPNLRKLTMNSTVKKIYDDSFKDNNVIETVIFNSGLTIGNDAFNGCTGLSTISIPTGLEKLGVRCFQGSGLKSLEIPRGDLHIIPQYCFADCTKLQTVKIGDSVNEIGNHAFDGCASLKTLSMTDEIDTLGTGAFQDCTALTTFKFPASLTDTGFKSDVLSGCVRLEKVTFPSSPQFSTIPKGTFKNCESLQSLEFPSKIKTIASSDVLENCVSLQYVTLSENMKSIPDDLFADCKALEYLKCPGDTNLGKTNPFYDMQRSDFKIIGVTGQNPHSYATHYGIPFESMEGTYEKECFTVDEATGELVGCDIDTLLRVSGDIITIPEYVGGIKVTSIDANVFQNRSAIKGVILPESIESIEPGAFRGCSGMTSAIVPSTKTKIGADAFKNTNSKFILYGTIDRKSEPFLHAMENDIPFVDNDTYLRVEHDDESNMNILTDYDETATSLTIPSGIDGFGYKTDGSAPGTSIFYGNDKLESISIEDAVKLNDHAFKDCKNLKSVYLPSTMNDIGIAPFYGCDSLGRVDISASNRKYSCDGGVIYEISGGEPSKLVELLPGAAGVSSFTIPNTVTSIEKEAFAGVQNVSQVTFSDGVSIIPRSCFQDSSVAIAYLTPAVNRIDEDAFSGSELMDIYIPRETTFISDTASEGVTGLVIHGYANTTAETYADKYSKSRDYVFDMLEDDDPTTPTSSSSSTSKSDDSSSNSSSSKNSSSSSSKNTSTKKTSTKKSSNTNKTTKKSSGNNNNSKKTSSNKSGSSDTSNTAAVAAAGTTATTTVSSDVNNAGGAGNANVDAQDSGLDHEDLISGSIDGGADNYVIRISKTQESKEAFEQALINEYGSLENLRYYPMDISLYDSTGTTKIEDAEGVDVTITIPIPEELALYGGNNHAAAVKDGDLEELGTRFSSIDGTPCVTFTANHFSPYGLYVDVTNLSANGTIDASPKTGDPIHPKWFLVIGLIALSIFLFTKKDNMPKPKAA